MKTSIMNVWQLSILAILFLSCNSSCYSQEQNLFSSVNSTYNEVNVSPEDLHDSIFKKLYIEIRNEEYKVKGTLTHFYKKKLFKHTSNKYREISPTPYALKAQRLWLIGNYLSAKEQLDLYYSSGLLRYNTRYYGYEKDGRTEYEHLILSTFERASFNTDAPMIINTGKNNVEYSNIIYNCIALNTNEKLAGRPIRLVIVVPYKEDFLKFRKKTEYELPIKVLAVDADYHISRSGEKYQYEDFDYLHEKDTYTVFAVLQTDKVKKGKEAELYPNVSFGEAIDARDGVSFKTITINGTTWMAENVSYPLDKGCWPAGGNERYADEYGRLYTWEAAQKACPPGWRIPTIREWRQLVDYVGPEYFAAYKLKSKEGWKGMKAFNTIGFNAFPAGERKNGKFYNIGKYTEFWSSSKYKDLRYQDISTISMVNLTRHVQFGGAKKYGVAHSLRCVKDK